MPADQNGQSSSHKGSSVTDVRRSTFNTVHDTHLKKSSYTSHGLVTGYPKSLIELQAANGPPTAKKASGDQSAGYKQSFLSDNTQNNPRSSRSTDRSDLVRNVRFLERVVKGRPVIGDNEAEEKYESDG